MGDQSWMAADLSVIFGNFALHVSQRQLTENGVPVPLGARAIDILLYLVQHHTEVVSKSELLTVVWRDRVVEENNPNYILDKTVILGI